MSDDLVSVRACGRTDTHEPHDGLMRPAFGFPADAKVGDSVLVPELQPVHCPGAATKSEPPFEVRPGESFEDAVSRELYAGYARLMGDPDPESFRANVERRRRVEAADPSARFRFIGDEDA